jgi:hypothetical protein
MLGALPANHCSVLSSPAYELAETNAAVLAARSVARRIQQSSVVAVENGVLRYGLVPRDAHGVVDQLFSFSTITATALSRAEADGDISIKLSAFVAACTRPRSRASALAVPRKFFVVGKSRVFRTVNQLPVGSTSLPA